jgi:hypothetical protein
VLICFTQIGQGQIRWDGGAGTSNWTDVLNWSGDALPTASDDVILDNINIAGSYTVTLAAVSAQTVRSIQIGYSGNVNTITLIISGSTNNVLTVSGGGSTALYIHDGGIIENQSSGTTRGILLNNNSDVFKMSGMGKYIHNSSISIPQRTGISTTSSNYDFATTSAFENLYGTATSFDATPTYGKYIINHIGTNTVNKSLTINGDLEITSGTFNVTTNGTYSLSVGGNVSISNAAFLQGTSTTGTATINIIGNITGAGTLKGNSSGGTANFTIGGDITSLVSLSTGTNSLTFSGGAAPVSFTPANSSTPTVQSITISNGKTVTLGANISVNTGSSFTVDGTLECGTNTIAGGGSFVLGNTATLKCGHANGIFGNIATIGANTFPASATYIFNGSVAQSVSNLFPDNLTGTLTIDNAQGVSMNVDRTISTGILNLQNGVLKTRADASTIHNFTTGSGATINVLSATSYVDGPLIMTLTSGNASLFPIGSGTAYRPLTMNFSVGQNVTAEMFNTAPSGSFSGIGVDKISTVRYYSVTNSTNSNVTVTIPWSTDDGVSDLSYITAVYGVNSAIWAANSRSGSTTGNATSGTVTGTFNNIIGADFTLGNITGGSNPLPVELTSFTASVHGNVVTLAWKTATEVDNYGFEIERTSLSLPFDKGGKQGGSTVVGFVSGAGNSNSPQQYSFVDKSLPAGNYLYRLKQIDNGGKYSYSEVVKVEVGTPTTYRLAQNYPNPFNPTTTIEYAIVTNQLVSLKVFNMLGKEVAVLVNEKKELGVYTVDYNASHLANGVYLYRLQAGDVILVKKMVVLK